MCQQTAREVVNELAQSRGPPPHTTCSHSPHRGRPSSVLSPKGSRPLQVHTETSAMMHNQKFISFTKVQQVHLCHVFVQINLETMIEATMSKTETNALTISYVNGI